MSEIHLPGTAETVVKTAQTYAKDLAERTIWSFLGGATAVSVAAGPADMFRASFWEVVVAGGLAALFALLKGVAARSVGKRNSASTAPSV
jgi:hypothetical protein